MKLNKNLIFFTGGGTGGHIYPGLAVADEIKKIARDNCVDLEVDWIGCSKGMDGSIIDKAAGSDGKKTVDKFYGIPSGKLRRYFSVKNFFDLFRIIGGFFNAYFILLKNKPGVLFSKGGFVSVPPCLAAKFLKIPVYTHECDFTLGLANRINLKSAKKMFVSYKETMDQLGSDVQKKVIVTGNPVRPVFYNTNPTKGFEFLKLQDRHEKPVLLVLGGSSGARQINNLVFDNIEYLCKNFIVVHQTGLVNGNDSRIEKISKDFCDSYKSFNFIHSQMPDVVACADLIVSRAGANSIWEAAVLYKPMLLIPLCGSGTRGDQVDNAEFFVKKEAAKMLLGEEADSSHFVNALEEMKLKENLQKYSNNIKNMIQNKRPAEYIAEIIFEELKV